MAQQTTTFQEPTSIEDADDRIFQLTQSIREITVQLSDHDRRNGNGNRVSRKDYHDWRKRAIYAKTCKESELAFVKHWRKEQNRKVRELVACDQFRFSKDDPVSLLAAVYKVLRGLHDSNVQMTKEELALMDVVENFLRGAV